MRTSSIRTKLPADAAGVEAPTRVWRPFPEVVADIVCVEETARDIDPRIHGRFAIILVRSPAVVRVESSRSVVAGPNSVVLVPALQLHALRGEAGSEGVVTVLLGPSQLEGLDVPERPTLVPDSELGAELGLLVDELRDPVPAVECVARTRSLLERLIMGGAAHALASPRRAATLAPVRDYLRGRLGEPVQTATLVPLAGLTECHLIRAFHLEFGLPPHAYHLRLRLARASELLARGLPISAATYECGFADQSHLSRKFKGVYGLTPAAWASAVADRRRPGARTKVAAASDRRTGGPRTMHFTLR